MKLYPFDDVAKTANDAIIAGATVHQQFLCSHCGTKQTIADPNVFHYSGICEECGKETDIKKNGCNYMMILGSHVEVALPGESKDEH